MPSLGSGVASVSASGRPARGSAGASSADASRGRTAGGCPGCAARPVPRRSVVSASTTPGPAARASCLRRAVGPALARRCPPMTAKPRTTIRGEPGTMGTSRSRRLAPAHEREAAQLDVEALRDDDVDAAPEGDGGDLDLGALDLGPAQVHVAAAHDRHGVRLPADAPAALGAVPAHDRDVPARCVFAGVGCGAGWSAAGLVGQVGHDRVEVAPGPWPRARARPARRTRRGSAGPRPRARAAGSRCGPGRRRPRARSSSPGPAAAGRAARGSGRSAMQAQSARSAGHGTASDLTTRQTPAVGQPLGSSRRARHHQCGGLRAVPAAGPGGHHGLHGERRRQGDPGGGLPRRGHHHHRGRGGPSGPARRPGAHPRHALVRHRRARLPRQDQRHRRRRRPAAAGRRRRLRLRRRAALGHGLPAGGARAASGTTWSSAPTCATACPTSARRVRRRRRRRRRARRRTARAPVAEFVGRRLGHRRVHRPLAGAGRPRSRSCGRSASARTATWPSGSDALAARSRRPGSRPATSTGWSSPACTGGPSRACAKKLGSRRAVARRRPHVERRPERRGPSRSWCWPPRSSRWPPGRRAPGTTVVARAPGRRRRRAWSCARPTRWRAGARPARWPTRWPTARRSPTGSSCPGGASCQPEPPRRPEPARVSSTAAHRNEEWKFGFVGSKDRSSGAVHLPPSRVSMEGGAVDDMEPVAMADATGTVVTSTIDRLAYSPSPPIVFAVVDFDGGGRYPVELTDTDADEIRVGQPGRDDVPPALQRRRHPRLLLEGAPGAHGPHGRRDLMGSHGIRDQVAIVGMGCTQFAEHWDKSLDDLIVDASTEAFASAGVDQGRRRRLLVRHGPERHERHHAGPAAAAAQQAGDPGRELLHHRVRGAARRGLRRGLGRLRRGHGRRRREGEGQRVPGPQRHEPARTTARPAP